MKFGRLLIVVAVALLSVFVFALYLKCRNVRTDVSHNDALWLPYKRGATYALTEDVFLIEIEKGEGLEPQRLALVPESDSDRGSGFYASPKTIKEYLESPENATTQDYTYFTNKILVRGIISKGTQLAPDNMQKNEGVSWFFGPYSDVTKYGKILTGNFRGKIVELSDVSWDFSGPPALSKYVTEVGTTVKPQEPSF